MKKKLLVFHPALAPYRVDFFNSIANNYDTTFYFENKNVLAQKFDQNELKKKIVFKKNVLKIGFKVLGRNIRFGILPLLLKQNPKVVITSEFGQITLMCIFYKFIIGYKLFVISDDSLSICQERNKFKKQYRKWLAQFINGLIIVNSDVINWYKINVNNTINYIEIPVIHSNQNFRQELNNALNQSNLNINQYNLEGKKVILFVGRLEPVKNLEFLIKLFHQLECKDVHLIIIGDGTMKVKLLDLVNKLYLSEKVIFMGRLEGVKLISWYNIAQLFILPSVYEPFGAVVNESLLGGCEVLCSKFAGSKSLIAEGKNGYIIDPNNIEESSIILEKIINKVSEVKNINKIRSDKMLFTFEEKFNIFKKTI